MERNDLLWLAGLWDAEGCFSTAQGGKPSPHGGKQMIARIAMTDADIIEYVHKLMSCKNTIKEKNDQRCNNTSSVLRKKLYILTNYGKEARDFALSLAPFLSNRRRLRIEELTEVLIEPQYENLSKIERFMWVAGYVEGEGSFSFARARQYGYHYVSARFKLDTTDEDAVNRVGDILGLPVSSLPRRNVKNKPQWGVETRKRDKVKEIADRLYPYMFSKKRTDIERVLSLPVGRLAEPYIKV